MAVQCTQFQGFHFSEIGRYEQIEGGEMQFMGLIGPISWYTNLRVDMHLFRTDRPGIGRL